MSISYTNYMEHTFSIMYGTGSVSGTMCEDNMGIGSAQVKNVSFGQANILADHFLYSHFDGIFGMAFKVLSQGKVEPPIVKMYNQNLIPSLSFSMKLNSEQFGSKLVLGGIDNSLFPNND